MRKIAILLALSLAACSSGRSTTDPALVRPAIEMVELYGPSDLGYARGQNTIQVEYGFRVLNRWNKPITLRRIDLSSVGGGGYVLRREDRAFHESIPADAYADVKMSARAYFGTTRDGSASREPVTVRAVLHFESEGGNFREILVRNLSQFPGR